MPFFVFLYFLFLSSSIIQAQNRLSTPMEILSFMQASPTHYEIEQLYGKYPRVDKQILNPGTYIIEVDKKEYILSYEEMASKKEKKYRKKALKYWNKENPDYGKVRKYYHKALKINPLDAQLYTYIAQSYLDEKNHQSAKSWAKKAIALNKIDYKAYWIYGESFYQEEQLDSALHYITLAHIFNRNNRQILLKLQKIQGKQEGKYDPSWEFDPAYKMRQSNDSIIITAENFWLTYAMYKAVWKYEPDYKYIKEQQATTDYLFQEELEASLGTFLTFSTMEHINKSQYPSMLALGKAIDKDLLEEYVMYEIILVKHPTLAAHLTVDFLAGIQRYIQEIRSTP